MSSAAISSVSLSCEYARVTDKLHGRVTRLFLAPLIRALKIVIGPHRYLDFMDSFRYALAGEFAMSVDLAPRA